MSSFIKFICPYEIKDYELECLYKDPYKGFTKLNFHRQIKFILGQAITLNYLNRVYHHELPYFISLWQKDLVEKFMPYAEEGVLNESESTPSLKWIYDFCLYLLKLKPANELGKIFISDINALLKNKEVEMFTPCTQIFYESYLMFLELEFCYNVGAPVPIDAHISGEIALPQFVISNSMLIEHDVAIGLNYNYNYEDHLNYGKHPLSGGLFSITSYWRNYNWRDQSFNSVVSVLATYGKLAMMDNRHLNSMLRAYYDLHQLMNPMCTSTATVDCGLFHDQLVYFLVDICTRFNIKDVDVPMLKELSNREAMDVAIQTLMDKLSNNVVEAKEALRSTLKNLGLSNMSGSSPMFVENADLVSILLDAGSKTEEDQQNEEEETDQDTEKDSKKENNPDSPEEDDTSDTDDQKEDDKNQDDDPSLDQEEQNQEEDQPASDADDTDEKDDTEDDNESNRDTSDKNQTKFTHTQKVPKPRIPGMNLKSGIKIELADDDETIDSYLYRKELGSFIDDVLSNPNHNFSVQQIEAFKMIKAQLLWSLNVQSLYHLLKAISKA